MLRTLIRGITLAVLCALPYTAAAQESLTLKREYRLMSLSAASDEATPVFIEADRIRGHTDREAQAEGNVRLRRRGASFAADEMRYDAPQDELNAKGNVRFESAGNVIEGERLLYNLTTDRGFMDKPVFTACAPARGAAAAGRLAVRPFANCAAFRADRFARQRRAAAFSGAAAVSRRAGELHDVRTGQRRLVHPRPRARHRQRAATWGSRAARASCSSITRSSIRPTCRFRCTSSASPVS